MSDLTLFVLETDLNDLSERQIEKIEEILVRSQKSATTEIEDISSALSCLKDVQNSTPNLDEVSTRKTPVTTRKTPVTTRKTPVSTRKTFAGAIS